MLFYLVSVLIEVTIKKSNTYKFFTKIFIILFLNSNDEIFNFIA